MSQPEKNKENAIVLYMSKKRKYKKKYRIKESDKITGYQVNSKSDSKREKDWFTDQYEKLIGKPLSGKELSTDEVLRQLQESTKYRWIPEANTYKSYTPQPGNVHYIEWKDPMVKVCQCPNNDCICSGNFMLPRKRIPRGERYIKFPWIRKLVQCFRKSTSQPKENFVQRLAAAVGVETAVYHDLERNGILNIRGAEFCMARCIKYYGPGHMPIPKNILDMQKLQSHQTPLNKETDEDEDRLDDGSSRTVSAQSTGESIIDNFSHAIHRPFSKAILRDIEGTELQISSCKSASNSFDHKSDHLCSFEKLFNIRELINMKKLKNQISLLKKNISSSILQIREKNSSVRVVTEQHEENPKIKEDSSEVVTIPTPYMGVVLRAKKKKPHESPTDRQPAQCSQADVKTVGETLLDYINPPETNAMSNVPIIENFEKFVKVNLPVPGIEVEKGKPGNEIEVQKRTSEVCDMKFVDSQISRTCDSHPNEPDESAILQVKSIDIAKETVKESVGTDNHPDSVEKRLENNKHQKSNDILHHLTSKSGDLKGIINEIMPETVIHTKQNNNFVKNGISINQLQDKNIKKFVKCVSYDNGILIRRNKEEENQHTSKIKIHLRSLSKTKTKINEQLLDSIFLPNREMKHVASKLIKFENEEVGQNINNFITDDSCNKQPYDSSVNSRNETEILKFLNTNISLPLLRQTQIPYNQSKKSQEANSTNLELKSEFNSKYKKSKYKGSFEQPIYENIKESIPQYSKNEKLVTLKSAVRKTRLLNKKVSNLSSMLNRILVGKIRKSVKSLPEPYVQRDLRKSYQTKKDRSEMERKTSKNKGEDPKSHEREIFSIQYSAISEVKCSSKFLKIEKESCP